MNQYQNSHWRRSFFKAGAPLLLLTMLVVAFQNCSSEIRDTENSVAMASSSQTEPSLNPLEGIIQADYSTFQNARLKANLFTLYKEKNTFSRFEVVTAPTHGALQILDHRSGKFIYDPDLDFIGVDEFNYNETLPNGDVRSRVTKIYVVRSSMLGDLKPALAVRAVGCIGCHSNIASNILTDFGAGGDGLRDYSFGKLAIGRQFRGTYEKLGINHGNAYFDHSGYVGNKGLTNPDGNFATMSMAAGTQIIIPKGLAFSSDLSTAKVNRPGIDVDAASIQTFQTILNTLLGRATGTAFSYSVKEYLESMSPYWNKELPKFTVSEVKSMYIGAPTAARIAALRADAAVVASPTSAEFIYVKESKASPDLSKIDLVGDVLYARDGFSCDGDLFINRKLVIQDMTLITNQGCRIYSPEVVYIQGRVKYEASKTYANMQITSSRAIMAGIGKNTCPVAIPAAPTDPGTGATTAQRDAYNAAVAARNVIVDSETRKGSLANRLQEWWTPSMFTRTDEPASGTMNGPEVSELKLYNESMALPLVDARCIEATLRSSGQLASDSEIEMDRMLLNAPKVHTRFRGNISGVVIAEIAFLAISNVKYNFNEVFTYVPVLPMLSPSDYLMIIDNK